MRKIISKEDYTLFFERKKNKDIDCVAYETGKHMGINDIGEAVGISRVSVRNNIRKSLMKIYNELKNKKISPVDIILSMSLAFNIKSKMEYKILIDFFPKDIRSEINGSAEKKL